MRSDDDHDPTLPPGGSDEDATALAETIARRARLERAAVEPVLAAIRDAGFIVAPRARGANHEHALSASDATLLDHHLAHGKQLLKSGEPLRAYDVLASGVEQFPGDPGLRQQLALALARSGAPQAASRLLTRLVDEGHRDEETLGILARTHKDMGLADSDPAGARHHLALAGQHYRSAFVATRGYWSGINAATMAVILGDRAAAETLARTVQQLCRARLDDPIDDGERYWVLSTLGEAATILREWSAAADWYGRAVELGRGQWGNLHTTRRQLRLLLRHLGAEAPDVESAFVIPRVCVFSGHLIDRPDRGTPRFPLEIQASVREQIARRLRELEVGFGYGAAACGGDTLFHEELVALGAESHVVLPYAREAFCVDSVDLVPGSDLIARFARVLERATDVKEISSQRIGAGDFSFEYANRYVQGLAQARAASLDTEIVALAAWDRRAGDGPGGTASCIAQWQAAGIRIEIVDLAEILDHAGVATTPTHATPVSPAPGASDVTSVTPAGPSRIGSTAHGATRGEDFSPDICGLLFADAVGFSKLGEAQVPLFVRHFLGMVGELARSSSHRPEVANTWGDGLYCVFRQIGDAGRFALDLCDRVKATDWAALGLPHLGTRIGVHAGPVHACTDPVTGRPNYVGAHVSRAARIEPITPPDHVYASEAFVALATASGSRDMRFTYVGQAPLAKNFGRYPMYLLEHR